MALDEAGHSRISARTATKNEGTSKRPWTASEDVILVQYVKDHGEGNWSSVEKNSGLTRSAKSCRLRWANHLRPNLKKDAFSAEEERRIFELHGTLGSKWSRIAAQLPGRTDNEIKNFWYTRYRRHRRTGLAINPQKIHQENKQINSLPPQSFASPNPDPLDLLNTVKSSSNNPPHNLFENSCFNNQLKLFRDSNGGLALSLMPSYTSCSSSSSAAIPFSNHDLSTLLQMPSIQENSPNCGFNPCPNKVVLEPPSILSSEAGTSIQALLLGDKAIATSNNGVEDYEKGDSIFRKEKVGGQSTADLGGVQIMGVGGFHGNDDFNFATNLRDTFMNNCNKSKAPGEGKNFMDDELSSLLNSFPLTVPIPNWDDCGPRRSLNLMNGLHNESENGPIVSQINEAGTSSGTSNQDLTFGSFFWDK